MDIFVIQHLEDQIESMEKKSYWGIFRDEKSEFVFIFDDFCRGRCQREINSL